MNRSQKKISSKFPDLRPPVCAFFSSPSFPSLCSSGFSSFWHGSLRSVWWFTQLSPSRRIPMPLHTLWYGGVHSICTQAQSSIVKLTLYVHILDRFFYHTLSCYWELRESTIPSCWHPGVCQSRQQPFAAVSLVPCPPHHQHYGCGSGVLFGGHFASSEDQGR